MGGAGYTLADARTFAHPSSPLVVLFTTVVCVWMGVTYLGTLYGTHRPSYQYKLDVVQYALPIEFALVALAFSLLATRINLRKYFPEAQSPINTYEVASTLRLMVYVNPFISFRKNLMKVKYRGDLRGAGTRALRQVCGFSMDRWKDRWGEHKNEQLTPPIPHPPPLPPSLRTTSGNNASWLESRKARVGKRIPYSRGGRKTSTPRSQT